MKKTIIYGIIASMLLSMTACGNTTKENDMISELGLNKESKDATEQTIEINSAIYSQLDFENSQEAEFAAKGLIAAPETLELKNENGAVIWSQDAYSFLNDYEKAPDTVNPALWENTKNNHFYGLFEVKEGIYQVRGYDMANMTFVESENGWIVLDPMMSAECTQAAMQLVDEHLGKRPVKAVIISHSHVDHYGGIKGIITEEEKTDAALSIEEQAASGKIPVIVPEGFVKYAVSENVNAGTAMTRRANYQYGVLLDADEKGKMGIGIGMGQSTGNVTFTTPTYEIKKTREAFVIDGVKMEFQLTPGTEAPAEMNTWFPQKKALWVAENCTGTLHNLYTLRGAQVRDGGEWAKYITEAITWYGKEVEVAFQSHNWPHWGNEVVNEYLENTAAVYKFINDQTLTYINQGYTSDEISTMIKLPEELAKNWYTRQFYGTVAHDSKAVYQKYMGWYDANPVNLNPLTPSESAVKWVEYLGDIDEVLRMAKEDYDAGEYQWVAEITNVLVYADPENEAARLLCADALEQLGYQSESGAWRNAYLSAALELREGNQNINAAKANTSGEMVMNMTASMIFDLMGIRMDKESMKEYDFVVNVTLPDVGEKHMLKIKDGVLLQYADTLSDSAQLSITCPKNALFLLLQGNSEGIQKAMKLEGDTEIIDILMENLIDFSDTANSDFNIVEP